MGNVSKKVLRWGIAPRASKVECKWEKKRIRNYIKKIFTLDWEDEVDEIYSKLDNKGM